MPATTPPTWLLTITLAAAAVGLAALRFAEATAANAANGPCQMRHAAGRGSHVPG